MSIESDHSPSSSNGDHSRSKPVVAPATTTTTMSAPAAAVPMAQQQHQPMTDLLMGSDMNMMQCDGWNNASQQPMMAMSMQQRPQYLASPAHHHGHPQAFFSCAPAQLTRHASLPVNVMRYSNEHQHQQYMMASSPAHAAMQMPTLSRHRSMGYINYTPTYVHHQATTPVHHVMHHQPTFDLSVSHQHHQPMNGMMKTEPLSSMSVEPIAFNAQESKMTLDCDGFEFDPLAYAVFGASSSGPNTGAKDSDQLQQLESAFDSLDKFLPDMEPEMFHHSASSYSNLLNSSSTPRHSSRGSLPMLLAPPHIKTAGCISAASPATIVTMGVATMGMQTPRSGTPKSMATCKVGGCSRRVRSKGFCKTHGGGRKCSIEGCKKSSQNGEFCIGHGGGKKCKEDGCAKAAQSHGLCKAHGGGARCKFANCQKSSQGGGLCRAHGGGKRCQAAGCPKGAQRGNFCATHGGFRNCKIEGCVRTDRGGGFCEVHRRGRLCKIEGCKKLSRNQGMCTMHIREEKQDLISEEEHDSETDCFSSIVPSAASMAELVIGA